MIEILINALDHRPVARLEVASRAIDALEEDVNYWKEQYEMLHEENKKLTCDLLEAMERNERIEKRMREMDSARVKTINKLLAEIKRLRG